MCSLLHRHLPPHILAAQPLDDLLTFSIVFLSTPYLHNPYIVSLVILSSPGVQIELRLTERQIVEIISS